MPHHAATELKVVVLGSNTHTLPRLTSALAETTDTHLRLQRAGSCPAVVKRVQRDASDAVIVDLTGIVRSEGLSRITELSTALPETPLLAIVEEADPQAALALLAAGAQDVLSVNQFDGRQLERAMLFALQRKRSEAKLRHQAQFDPLTGLVNRRAFELRLDDAIRRANRHRKNLAVMYLDLDHFKQVNDTLGHAAGDDLLCEVARRLKAAVRATDTVSRRAGDEFTLLLEGLEHADTAAVVARKLVESVAAPYRVEQSTLHVSASIGIATGPQADVNTATLLERADAALYLAKHEGRSTYRFYNEALDAQAIARLERQRELEHALANNHIGLVYQPRVNLREGRVAGAEALARWRLEDGGVRYPSEFIPGAEEAGLMVALGEQILHDACAQARLWLARADGDWRLSVNVSARQFASDEFVASVDRILADAGLPAERLELEFTETALCNDVDAAGETLNALRARGISTTIDDYGTGVCSLGHLRRLPLDRLKIDKSFVQGVHEQVNSCQVRAIVEMARALNLTVVAEGVETSEQLYTMQQMGADEVQGYLVGAPAAGQDVGFNSY